MPWRSDEMRASAVATMVWSSAARNMPSIRPIRMMTVSRWLKRLAAGWAFGRVDNAAGLGDSLRRRCLCCTAQWRMTPTALNDHRQKRIAGCTAAHGGGQPCSARPKKAYSLAWRHPTMGAFMFDLDRFIADCRSALAQDSSPKAIRESVARAVADPNAVLGRLGEPRRGGIDKLHPASDLTILNVISPPFMTIMPHNHQMWAVIRVYTRREDNIFWRRLSNGTGSRVEAAGAKALCEKDAEPLGRNIIHSVTNPIPRLSAAIHVYGGDFFAAERSEWDPETLSEQRYDVAKNMQLFERANATHAPG